MCIVLQFVRPSAEYNTRRALGNVEAAYRPAALQHQGVTGKPPSSSSGISASLGDEHDRTVVNRGPLTGNTVKPAESPRYPCVDRRNVPLVGDSALQE